MRGVADQSGRLARGQDPCWYWGRWTWEYVPDAASVVGGLTPAQIDQVEV